MQILDNISSKLTSSSKSDAFLVIDQVSKVYDTPKGKYIVLEDVNLQVKESEFICIIGHSGCGKSTLLNMVAGFNQPTTGVVSVQGQLITEPGPERMVVFQNYSLLPWLTAKENIHLAVDSVNPDKSLSAQLKIVQENLELVGLSEAANKKPSQLSGGMKQRVSIARALATRPQMLILDEPFGALDPITREELQEELLNIWQDHRITVLMITHDIDEALFLADRLVMMTNGPAAQIGEILDIPFSRPRNRAKIMEDPRYYELRNYALDFLFRRFAHHEEDEETTEEITTEDTTPDTGLAQSTTIAPSSSHIATEVLNMQPNRPDPDENPYAKTPEPELTPAVDPVTPPPSEEMSPEMKTGMLFALWGVILATLVGSLLFNSTTPTPNQEATTPESSATTMETETTSVTETVTPIITPSPTLSPTPTATLSPGTVTSVSPSPSLAVTPAPTPDAVATTSPSPNSLASTPTTTSSPSSTTAIAPTPTASPTVSPSAVTTASPTPESLASATPSPASSPAATATSPTTTASPTSSPSSVATSPTGSTTSPSSTTTTTPSAADLEQLNQEVFTQINEAWTSTPVTALSIYVVKVSQTGDILSYEAKSPDATQNLNNTPLPKLVKSDATQTPYTQFEVTFTPLGTLDIKPAQ